MTLRVLHGPQNIAGHAAGLARAERSLGLDSRVVALRPARFGFPADETLLPDGAGLLAEERARWRLLRRAVQEADVVHFNFGKTFTPDRTPSFVTSGADGIARRIVRPAWSAYQALFEQRDLPMLKKRGKGVVVTFQGNDARQGDATRQRCSIHAVDESVGVYNARSDEHKRRRIARFARYASHIFALNPDLLPMLPEGAEFLPYAHVDPREWTSQPPAKDVEVPLVLHAPSDRRSKGTRFIVQAVERLRNEGVAFDFRLVENMDHAEARSLYARADLVIDQLLVGWYGGLAVEAMAMGKPVVAYIRGEDLGGVPSGLAHDLPIIQAGPADIVEVLRLWLTEQRGELAGVGVRSRRFVERWHDPVKVARETRSAYRSAG